MNSQDSPPVDAVTTVEYLRTMRTMRTMRDLLEKGWTQGGAARDANNEPCSPTSSEARCFCMVGALDRASNVRLWRYESARTVILDALRRREQDFIRNVSGWNDDLRRTQQEVLEVMDDAIANYGKLNKEKESDG